MDRNQFDAYFEARKAFLDRPGVRINTWTDKRGVIFVRCSQVRLGGYGGYGDKLYVLSYGITPTSYVVKPEIFTYMAKQARREWDQ